MKNGLGTVLIVSILFLMGCSSHHDASEFDLPALAMASKELATFGNGIVPLADLPKKIQELRPESVFKKDLGVYIRLDSFMVEESGLFYPFIKGDYSSGGDPSYVSIGNNMYSYVIKG